MGEREKLMPEKVRRDREATPWFIGLSDTFLLKTVINRCRKTRIPVLSLSPTPDPWPPKPHLFVKTGRNSGKFGRERARTNSETGVGEAALCRLNLSFLTKRS